MRANVLNDAALVKRAGQFAWLSVDVDKPENQNLTAKAGGEGVPMFLVIDPATENVILRWYGSATAPQISRLLDAHEIIIRDCRELADRADKLGDQGTNDIAVSDVLRTNEMQVWFLSEHLVRTPLVDATSEAA